MGKSFIAGYIISERYLSRRCTYLDALTSFFDNLSGIVWGPFLIILLIGTGILLTFRLGGIQFTKLGYALRLAFQRSNSEDEGDISHFAALMTALAATIGTGNIVGVATAIYLGGPGAVFWMWLTALFGMATKYAEAILAVKYRVVDDAGQMSGGPMYYISRGLKMPLLGSAFALFGILAAFGVGASTQANSIAAALRTTFGVPPLISAIILIIATALVLIGGIKSIGRVSEVLVPVMAVFYILGSLAVLALNYQAIPEAFRLIFSNAFTGTAAVGGFAGATLAAAIQRGVSRGIFSNESGLGSAPIAAAAAKTDVPARQALVSMTGTFIDTIIVCTLTALVLLTSGLWNSGLRGAALTVAAFNASLPTVGGLIVSIGLIMFAYSTIIGWAYYGERCAEYLWGARAVNYFRAYHLVGVGVGALANIAVVWSFADVANGLMAFPNLVGLIGLSGVVVAETRSFWEQEKKVKHGAPTSMGKNKDHSRSEQNKVRVPVEKQRKK